MTSQLSRQRLRNNLTSAEVETCSWSFYQRPPCEARQPRTYEAVSFRNCWQSWQRLDKDTTPGQPIFRVTFSGVNKDSNSPYLLRSRVICVEHRWLLTTHRLTTTDLASKPSGTTCVGGRTSSLSLFLSLLPVAVSVFSIVPLGRPSERRWRWNCVSRTFIVIAPLCKYRKEEEEEILKSKQERVYGPPSHLPWKKGL